MATFDVFNLKREKVGSIDLADEVFATEVREHLFYEVVKAQLASKRQGTQCAKNQVVQCSSAPSGGMSRTISSASWSLIKMHLSIAAGTSSPSKPL